MTFAVVSALVMAAVVVAFLILNWHSGKTYRPTPLEIKGIVVASIEGRLDLYTYDQFVSVPIAYDKRLDRIRERYDAIVNDRAYMEGEVSQENATPLNAAGKEKLQALVLELELICPRDD